VAAPDVASVPAEPRSVLHGGWPVLAGVIDHLDTEVIQVIQGPRPGSVRVNDVSILDRTDPRSLRACEIVLGVGLTAGSPDAVAFVDRAGRADAAAVVLRLDEEVDRRAVEIAASHGLAILTVPPEMPWGQVYSLIKTAIVSAGAGGEPDAFGVAVGDLFSLSDAIAAAVGGPVTIEDPQWRVLAFSNLGHEIDEARRRTILGRGVPPDWRRRLEEASVAQSLRVGQGVVRFDDRSDPSFAPRIAAPVRAGSELLGSIWVAEASSPLGAAAEEALCRAAELAAIHLICHRASEDIRRRARGAFVREVLEGRVPRAGAMADWPLRATGPFTVIALQVAAEDGLTGSLDSERILSVVSLYCEDVHSEAMCAFVDDRFWALVPTPHGDQARMVTLAQTIVERVDRVMGTRLLAGVGIAVPQVGDIPRSRRAAEQALRVITLHKVAGPVAHIEDVRAHAVLFELLNAAESLPGLLPGKIEHLVEYDREHDTAHTETLRVYLECWGDVAAASRRLGVHPNTLRYRVRRLVELSGLDLDDPDERFVAELQLRLHGRLGAGAPPSAV
jgi:PucR-like helix-turn-helix protein/diguanylate cyclase with GGDEF domain/purine catabolism regulatory family protein